MINTADPYVKKKQYILYGASFNPPHLGHFSAITQMLEQYDVVIVFPYPKKYVNGQEEILPALKQRMEMLEMFAREFFPQMADRLVLVNLAEKLQHKDRFTDGIVHTYDYLKYLQQKLPHTAELNVCLGFEAQNAMGKDEFYKEEQIKAEFNHFYLQEESNIKSQELREFFSTHKNLKSQKDEEKIKRVVGNALAEYIFTNNLYGIKKKKISPKTSPLASEPAAIKSGRSKKMTKF